MFPRQVQQPDLGTPGSGDVDDWDDKAALMVKQVQIHDDVTTVNATMYDDECNDHVTTMYATMKMNVAMMIKTIMMMNMKTLAGSDIGMTRPRPRSTSWSQSWVVE